MLFCCSENPNLRINMSSVRLCKTKLLHVSVSSQCSDDVLVLSGTKNTWWRLKCFSRHDLDMIRLSEKNNRVQSHTQSCECLRVFSGVTLLCVVQFVLWTWWVLTCIRTRFTMHRLDLLLSIIFYFPSDVFGNVGRVLNRVLTHWRVVSVEDQNF